MSAETPNVKRKKPEVSSSPDTPEYIDYKRAKQILSISESDKSHSSSESDTDQRVTEMAETEEDRDLKLLKKMDDLLKVRLDDMKNDVVREVNITLREHVDRLEGKLFSVETKTEQVQRDLELECQKTKMLEAKLKDTETSIQNMSQRLVDLEQYSRRNNIKIFGLEEAEDEDIKKKVVSLITEKVKVKIDEDDIDVAHRFNTRSEASKVNGARPIIVKLQRRDLKLEILKSRRNLKASGVFLCEHLCKPLNALFNRVRRHDQVTSAWTWEGAVYGKIASGKTFRVNYGQTVDDAMKKI